ncbi:Pre-mRNA-splicing factor [Drechslerella dactyloides]|uniref:Pre-mRNA-splicing factor n=1 Tax=Drechslerella dactyloides TaxID=74499 RepID=A0AAD6ISB6_DREDA|nr:Pre-mRNA-splicing factor [Drechslerella dactyloides]
MSDTRLYLGNLPKTGKLPSIRPAIKSGSGALVVYDDDAGGCPFRVEIDALAAFFPTKKDVEDFFVKHGHGTIQEIKLMNGFGFIEYSSPADARDIVPIFHALYYTPAMMAKTSTFTNCSRCPTHADGKEFLDSRLTVQFARGPRPQRSDFNGPSGDRTPRPRRTPYRMNISGLPTDTSWQDLKDFARKSGVDVVFSEVSRNRDGSGIVEFETADDLRIAINKLDNYDFKGGRVSCTSDNVIMEWNINHPPLLLGQFAPQSRNSRGRSRSPPPPGRRNGGGYSPPREGRGYSPRRGGYSPHRGDRGGYSPRAGRGGGYSPQRGGGGGGDNRERSFRERSPYGGSSRDDRRGGGGGGENYRNDHRRFSPSPYDRRSPDGYGPRSGGRYDEPRGGSGGGGGGGGRYDEPPRRYDDDKGRGYGNEYGGPPARGSGGRSPPRNYSRDDYDRGPRSGGRY